MNFRQTDYISKNAILTIGTRSLILLANFLIVAFTTNIWGASGRGEIALIITNVAIISILSNIVCGNTIAYNALKEERDLLIVVALAGAIIFSIAGSVVFSLTTGFRYFKVLFIISFLNALTGAISNYWLGKNNIRLFNILTFLNPVLVLFFLFIFWGIFRIGSINACFYAYYAGLGSLLIIGLLTFRGTEPFRFPKINHRNLLNIIRYGSGNEFNYFIQFLNYRLSYYFIARILGLAPLGIFSIAISCAEAIWVVSKSMSTLNYSDILILKDRQEGIASTIKYAKQSFWISLILMLFVSVLPESVYEHIFGSGFGSIRTYLVWMIPGIIALAVSNLYGHYFAGIGKLKIVRNKSLIGLVPTIILLFLLTEKFLLKGVCISLNASYLLSSYYLYYKFRKEEKMLKTQTDKQSNQ
jgi:O-antigen/teichoic acid export membrane protein